MQNSSINRTRASLVFASFLAIAAAGCNDDDTVNTVPIVGTTVTAATGVDNQSGVAGTALANAITVHVTDASGTAAPATTVTFAVTAGGGTLSSPTAVTNATGDATVTWTLGTVAGANTLTATLPAGGSVTINATGTAGAAAGFAIVSGNNQTFGAGGVSAPMVVKVTDTNGNAVSGATVAWAVTGGGTLSATSTTTDASGNAQVTLASDAAAVAYTVTATSGTMTPQVFSITTN